MWHDGLRRSWKDWFSSFKVSSSAGRAIRDRNAFRSLRLEPLERRQLLTANLPYVSLVVDDNLIGESGEQARVTAVLSATASQQVTVKLGFSGTATNPSDYSVSGTSIVVSPGQLTGSIVLKAINNAQYENDETAIVSITRVTNGYEQGQQQVSITIDDDDAAPTVTLTPTVNPIAENRGTTRVVAQLSTTSCVPVYLSLSFSGTATNGVDYSRSSGTICIPAFAQTGAITIVGRDDTIVEGTEQIIVSLSSCQDGIVGTASSVAINIADDDQVASITAVNDALSPLAEDATPRSISFASLLANDVIPSGTASATITSVSGAVGGTVAISGTNVIFTPTPNYNGPASFLYTLSASSATSQATASFTITEVNDAPIGVNDTSSNMVEDDSPRTFTFASLLANDSKGPTNEASQTLTISNVVSGIGGTVSIVGTNVIFTPTPDYNGPASFVYTLLDNGTTAGVADPKTATASVNSTITEVNDAPLGTNDTLTPVAEDSGARTIPIASLLANDTKGPANESAQTLSILTVGSAVGGTVALSGTNVIFTPTADFNGPASFVYSLQDNGTTNGVADSKSATASVSFALTEVNDAPIGTNDALMSIAEDSGVRTISFASLLGNDSTGPANESGQALTIVSVGSAVGGTVAISGTNVIFTPTADYNGPASFVYTLQDNGTTNGVADPKSATASVSFAITEVNDAPVGTSDALTSIAEDSGVRTISFASLLGNDSTGPANESGQALTIVSVGSAVGGTVALSGTNVIFTPTADYNGPVSFVYTLQDNGTTNGVADSKSATASVSFALTEVNDAPIGTNDALTSIAEDSGVRTISFASLLGNDSTGPANEFGQTLIIVSVGSAVGGTVAISGTNVIFTPTADFNGPASFVYSLQDDGTTAGILDPQAATALVSFAITEVNDAPIGTNDALTSIAEDSGVRTISFASLLGNDSTGPANESGQALTIVGVDSAVGGTVAISGTNVIFTPTTDYNGPASFVYTLQDDGTTNGVADLKTATATVNFSVTEVNDAPTGVNDTLAMVGENSGPQSISFASLIGNDSTGPANESGQSLTIISVGSAIGGTVTISGANVIFTPTTDYFGPASFVYTLQDNGTTGGVADPLSATATASFIIAEVNSPPVAGNDSLTAVAEDSGARTISFASLLGNDTPGPVSESGQSLTIVGVSSAVGGTAVLSGTDVVFTPTANYNGPASFTYTIQDNGTTNGSPDPKTASATVSFTVTEVNDAPTAVADTLADVVNTGPVSIPISTLLANDSRGPSNESSQTLTLISVTNVVGGTAQVIGTNVVFTPTAGLEAPGGFLYSVQDDGTTNGSPDPLTAVGTVSFNVVPPPNIPPAVDLNGAGVPGTSYPATMTLIGGTVAIVNPATATVIDPDPTGILSATITITNPIDGPSEVLAVNTSGTSLSASYNGASGVLTLTGLATAAEYQQVIRTTTYTNLSFNPAMSIDRTIRFVLNDGKDLSNVAEATVNYNVIPSPPVVDLDGAATVNFSYAADYLTYNGPVAIAATDATLIDTSNVYLASMTVTLVTPSDGLLEVLAANTTGTPITSSYAMNGMNAVLTLTGLGTVAQYEQVLRTVTYDNTANLPTIQSRLIKVVANDGTFDSSERTTTLKVIAVNGAPKVTTTAGSTPYVRGNLAGAVVDSALTLTDPGGAQFQNATVAITGGFVPGLDRLSYNGAGGIPSSFNSTTGILTLTGFTSIANYQTALRAIRFVTLSTAAVGPRTISFSVRDVTAATNGPLWSNVGTKVVNVTAAQLATVTNVGSSAPVIANSDLQPIVDEAIARWQRAGASLADITRLKSTPVEIRDLDESASLGTTDGKSVTIDDNAVGMGWFVDRSPRNDREFDERVGRFEKQADEGPAVGRYDLLTVVMHEFGHVLGLDDLNPITAPHQLMTGELTLGTRRSAPRGHADANGQTIWYVQESTNDGHNNESNRRHDDQRLRREVIDRLFTIWS